MAQGAQRMDALFAQALAAGRLQRDSSLNLPPPPIQELPVEQVTRPANITNAYQVQVIGKDVTVYNFAMAHLRTLPGIESATPQQINPGGTSYVLVAYRGDIAQLAAALSARGWIVDTSGTVVRLRSSSEKPPALPPPPKVVPQQPQPAPQPAQPQQAATPPPGRAQ
jgi:hypothetical protein